MNHKTLVVLVFATEVQAGTKLSTDATCNDGVGILGVGGVAVQPVSP